MIENKDNISNWRDIPCSWIVRISTVKMTILSKAIYEKMEYLSSYSMILFTELEQIISQFVWKHTQTKIKIKNKTKQEKQSFEKEEWS